MRVYERQHNLPQSEALDALHTFLQERLLERLDFTRTKYERILVVSNYTIELPFSCTFLPQHQLADHLELGIRYDLILSYFHVHWLNDIPGFFAQCRMLLAPGACLLGVLCGQDSLFTLKDAFAQAEIAIYQRLSTRFSPMIRTKDVASLLQRAGFQHPVSDIDRMTLTYDHIRDALLDLRQTGQNNAMLSACPPLTSQELERANSIFQTQHQGQVPIDLLFLSAWNSHA